MRVNMPADSANDDKPKQLLGISGAQTIGSALAAVTSALVGSFLGVAGTLIGAALGSIVATVGAALYARTLSSAATVALRTIPQRRAGGLPADDGDMLAASAPAESGEPRAKRVWRKLTPKTWIKVGAVSAAAFVIAMVGVTAVEFGTKQPLSTLVSSTSGIDGGATGQTTTLGKALTGNPTVPDDTDKSAKNREQVPGVERGGKEEGGLTTDVSPSRGAGTDVPGTDVSTTTPPADPAPGTEPSPEPSSETAQTSAPGVPSDSGSAEPLAP
jgi:hypothetical protein